VAVDLFLVLPYAEGGARSCEIRTTCNVKEGKSEGFDKEPMLPPGEGITTACNHAIQGAWLLVVNACRSSLLTVGEIFFAFVSLVS